MIQMKGSGVTGTRGRGGGTTVADREEGRREVAPGSSGTDIFVEAGGHVL